jgi:hypothetical protein
MHQVFCVSQGHISSDPKFGRGRKMMKISQMNEGNAA